MRIYRCGAQGPKVTHQVGIHLPGPQPLLSFWPQGEGVLEAIGTGEGDRWLHLQGAKPLATFGLEAKPWLCSSHLLVLFFSLANPRNGLLRNDQKVHRSLRGHITEYETLRVVTGQRPPCYFNRLMVSHKFLRGRILRAPHLLVLIQNVSWEASIQDPREDSWAAPLGAVCWALATSFPSVTPAAPRT